MDSNLLTNNSDSKHVILIVEDNAINAMVMERFLEKSSLFTEVIHAINGQEAIDFCATNKAIDIVLMDIGLPIKDGYEATKEIKLVRPNLPIIAQTAYTAREDRERISLAGFSGLIPKPLNYEDLIPVLQTHLQ